MKQKTDGNLFNLLKEGDKNALSELYLKYFDYLMHYGIRIVPDKFLIEEGIQEMFMYIFEARQRLGIVKNAKAYLFRSLRRRILEKIKAERKLKMSRGELYERTNIQFSVDEISFLKETRRSKLHALQLILNNLPWRQREAIYLRYYNGLSTKEIAEVMGVANQTILNTLHQALKKMRNSMDLQKLI